MPVGIIKPSNQIKHTNISWVRMKKGKKRFEIACYKNKIMDFRNNVDTELDNIVQSHDIYVGRSEKASKADLAKAWPGKDDEFILRDILKHGEFQVGEKERNAQLDRIRHEVVDIVAGKVVDPRSNRVYPPTMIEKALDQLSSQASHQQIGKAQDPGEQDREENADAKKPRWKGVVPTKEAKAQALAAIKALVAWQPIPIMRARMRIRVACPVAITKHTVKRPQTQVEESEVEPQKSKGVVKDIINSFFEETQSAQVSGDEWEITGFVDPGAYKPLSDFIGSQTKGRGRIEILDTAVKHEDE